MQTPVMIQIDDANSNKGECWKEVGEADKVHRQVSCGVWETGVKHSPRASAQAAWGTQLPIIEKVKTVGDGQVWRVKGRKESCFEHVEFEMAITAQVGTPMVRWRCAEFREETGLEKAIWDTTAHTWD